MSLQHMLQGPASSTSVARGWCLRICIPDKLLGGAASNGALHLEKLTSGVEAHNSQLPQTLGSELSSVSFTGVWGAEMSRKSWGGRNGMRAADVFIYLSV